MKTRILRTILAALLLPATFHLQPSALSAPGTAFTYQGQLKDGPAPANGLYDLKFSVFSVTSGGSPSAGPRTNSAVAVSNGLFTTLLDFGPDLFDGAGPVLLEIAVSPSGGGTFITLNPRQLVTPGPHSISSSLAFQAVNALNALNVANGVAVTRLNNLSDNVTLAAGQNVTITPSGNTLTIAAPGGVGPWLLNGTNTFYNGGKVGIGTTNPQSLLNVNGSLQWGGTTADYVYSGEDGLGAFFEQHGTSPAKSSMRFQSSKSGGGVNYSQFFIDPNSGFSFGTLGTGNGNVGIGTATPTAKLDVRGNIKLGSTGQLFAPGGEENLRIIRGVVNDDGTIHTGTGFNVSPGSSAGIYNVTFTTQFANAPAVTCAAQGAGTIIASWTSLFNNRVTIITRDEGGGIQVGDFSFIAVGPR